MTALVEDIVSHAGYLARAARGISVLHAEDLAQQTVARAIRFRGRFVGDADALRAWLYVLMRNEFKRMMRLEVRAKLTPLGYTQPVVEAARQVHAVELGEVVRLAAGLPERQRLLLAAAVDAPSYAAMATEFGMRVGTVKSALSRARAALGARQ